MLVRSSVFRPAKQLAAPLLACLCLCLPSLAQQPLPDAPRPQPSGTLTLNDRFHLQVKTSLSVSAFLVPVGDALVDMANPPDSYPREWRDGGSAFGRLYGAEFARHATAGFTHFTVAAIDREDPRYYPSTSHGFGKRTIHALWFTIIDRSDSGHRALAVSNLAASMAAGSIGMAFYPDGYNDFTHAYQRAAIETTSFASHNLIAEFSPEIVRALHKMHISDRIADAFLPPVSPSERHRP